MIKKLGLVLILTLAVNFMVAVGGVGYLWSQGKLGQEQLLAMKDVLFPPEVEPAPATQPSADEEKPLTPILKLEALLDEASPETVDDTLRHIRTAFDSRMVVLDRRRRELADLQRTIELARQQAVAEQSKIAAKEQALLAKQQTQASVAADEGFQESLGLYQTMQPKQVKAIFTTLEEDVVVRYLSAMEPRQAAKVIKEFKSPAETAQIQRVLEKIRQAESTATSPMASAVEGE